MTADDAKDYIMERINALDSKGWYVVGQTLADIRQCCAELPFKPKPNKDYVPSDFLHYLNEVEKCKEVLTKSEIKIQIMAILATMYHMNNGFTPDQFGNRIKVD